VGIQVGQERGGHHTGGTLDPRLLGGAWLPDHAQIKPRKLLDVNSQRMRRIPGGEVVEFLD